MDVGRGFGGGAAFLIGFHAVETAELVLCREFAAMRFNRVRSFPGNEPESKIVYDVMIALSKGVLCFI